MRGQGNKGVTLFFVISGFLIVTLLLRAKSRLGTFSLGRFWGRRMCRIFPVYYAVLAVYAAGVTLFPTDSASRIAFFEHLPAYATFTSNWFVQLDAPRVIFFFAWSLAAEEQFYLVWPWVERFLSAGAAMSAAVIALVLTQAASFAFGPVANSSLALKIFTSVPAGILLGVILAHVLHARRGFELMRAVCGQMWSAPLFALVTIGALGAVPMLGEDLGSLVAAVAMVPLVASCVVREDHGLAWLLRQRAVAWIGTVSYGMYLLHMASVHAAHRFAEWANIASPLVVFGLSAAIAVSFATVSYFTLERFFLGLKDHFKEGPRAVQPRWARLPLIGSLFS
jgi:peptidoglycan/LPS O-acetylase OafA/YrhL